jgi:hypothetical protein
MHSASTASRLSFVGNANAWVLRYALDDSPGMGFCLRSFTRFYQLFTRFTPEKCFY